MEGLKNQSVHGKIANAGKNLKKSFERNIKDGFGEWVFTPQTITGTLTDFTRDLSVGAASSAAGAAIGSFFLPPVGTIVGAAAGMAADYVINNVGIFDRNGEGKKIVRLMWKKKS